MEILLDSRKPSTRSSSDCKWKRFYMFVVQHKMIPSCTLLGISVSPTIVWAGTNLFLLFLSVKQFLHMYPPIWQPFPQWNLHLILTQVMSRLLHPVVTCSLRPLCFKTSMLIPVWFSRRASKLAALGAKPPFSSFIETRSLCVQIYNSA